MYLIYVLKFVALHLNFFLVFFICNYVVFLKIKITLHHHVCNLHRSLAQKKIIFCGEQVCRDQVCWGLSMWGLSMRGPSMLGTNYAGTKFAGDQV